MPTEKHPKFSELLDLYTDALAESLDAQDRVKRASEAADEASNTLAAARHNLVTAMKAYGISSIREHSWDEQYLYLTVDGTLEPRTIVSADEADKKQPAKVA
jgi:hypothetical protein